MWYDGFERISKTEILVGVESRCICCGRVMGADCYILDGVEIVQPKFPFSEDNCPICLSRGHDVLLKEATVAQVRQRIQELQTERAKKMKGNAND
jgi:hypothetical protein